jgi:hypothetical protein
MGLNQEVTDASIGCRVSQWLETAKPVCPKGLHKGVAKLSVVALKIVGTHMTAAGLTAF